MRALLLFPLAAVLLYYLGCDAKVRVSSCTNFSEGSGTGTGAASGTGSGESVRGCDGTVVVVVHDAPLDELTAFQVTIRRLELVSAGRLFTFFNGERREDLLEHRERGFLLGRRDDVPEADFDLLRIELSDLGISPEPAGSPPRLVEGLIEVPLDPPLSVARPGIQRLRVDIDVEGTLAGRTPGDASPIEPVVIVHGGDAVDTALSLAPTAGTAARVDATRARFLFVPEDGAGSYWTTVPPGLGPLEAGDRLIIEASLLGDAGLRAENAVILR